MSSIYTTNIFQKFQGEILRIPSCNAVHIQQEGDKSTYLVKQLVMKTNGEKRLKDYRVIWNGSDKVSCICGLFGFNGYLCRHAMVVLFVVGVYEIPSHYILKRWTRDAKIVDICNGVEDSGPEFVVKCFSDLRADSIKLAEEGSISKERYKATKAFLKDALIKVTSMNKVPVTVPKKNSKEANLVT
ncbi:hypothetical protein GIB67_004604 [Kingdonia uniflora]|uniref:Protein FAR1-RELATED SEQUENCE n=1 Tax=Kingdonia uniflora TaxID=39325 RepID=A0A7J7MD07_9MAGN|nr:hypothetical protein GIB67_004604 [Kingdonia uniflora]